MTLKKEVGSYTLYEMTFEGELFDNAFLKSAEFDLYTLELNEDGTGTLTIDNACPLVWKDGTITITSSGATYTYKFQDGKITLTETTGDIMVFQKFYA